MVDYTVQECPAGLALPAFLALGTCCLGISGEGVISAPSVPKGPPRGPPKGQNVAPCWKLLGFQLHRQTYMGPLL